MTTPGPGWYVDPENTYAFRWWSGEGWTDHRMARPPELMPEPAADAYVPGAYRYSAVTPTGTVAPKLGRGERDRLIRRNNVLGWVGCVLALVGFLFNPFAMSSILAIVFSSIGLARARQLEVGGQVSGRGTALAGLIIGIVGLGLFAWNVSRLVS